MKLLGDPHLGRSFINGVPLVRRGERERMVFNQFHNDILVPGGDLHVCMGDLFDKAIVPYSTIMNTALAYTQAAQRNPNTNYVILKGNHDWMRDLEKPSAFDLFAKMVNHIPNIKVVTGGYSYGTYGFFAWHPTISATQMLTENNWSPTAVFGHWDIDDYGGDNLNLIPTKTLSELGVKQAYTGHIHKPQEFERDNVDVVVVGSMQPYAHGEQINDDLYVTLTKKTLLKTDPVEYVNKCVRVDLTAEELLDVEVNCLQLTVRKEQKDGEKMEVSLGDFDMNTILTSSFAEEGVSEEITKVVLDRYEASKIHETG